LNRGDVYMVALDDPAYGHEQGKPRPSVIVQINELNRALSTLIVIPFTSQLKAGRFPSTVFIPKGEGGLIYDSIALCHQVRVVDKKRLGNNPLGKLTNERFNEIRLKLAQVLGFAKL
jgi:mRNA interferase MazF